MYDKTKRLLNSQKRALKHTCLNARSYFIWISYVFPICGSRHARFLSKYFEIARYFEVPFKELIENKLERWATP